MITVSWDSNREVIRSTICNTSVYKFVSDDTCPLVDDFILPALNDKFFVASCYDEGVHVGCFCFIDKSKDEVEIHTCLLPQASGNAVECAKKAVDLLFRDYDYLMITTFIPVNNVPAKKLAIKCGGKYEGISLPFIINGEEIETHKYILSRGDVCQ